MSFDETGLHVWSFGEEPDAFRPGVSDQALIRALAPSADGSVWAAHWSRYRLEKWTPGGSAVERIERDVEWFPDHPGDGSLDPDNPWLPKILDLQEDRDGRLWLLIRIVSNRWTDGLAPVADPTRADGGRYVVEDPDVAFDTIVEILDPSSGTVVASRRLDALLLEFIGPLQVVSQPRHGLTPRVQVWDLVLSDNRR